MLLPPPFAFHATHLLGLVRAMGVNGGKTCLWIPVSNRERQAVGFPVCQGCWDLPGNRLFRNFPKIGVEKWKAPWI